MLPQSRTQSSRFLELATRLSVNRHVVRIVLMVAVVLGIVAGVRQHLYISPLN